MKYLKIFLSAIYAVAMVVLCQQIIVNSFANQKNKVEYAELNSIKYGLFSVDEWKNQLVVIVSREFDKLYVSNTTERELRAHISVILNKMIDEAAEKIKSKNEKTTKGKFKQMFINAFVDMKEIKKGIPSYTDAVIQEMKKKKTKEQMKTMVNDQLEDFATKTADTQDRSKLLEIYEATGTKDIDEARLKVDEAMTETYVLIVKQAILFIILLAVPFMVLMKRKEAPSRPLFAFLILSLVLLLVAGVATPMIDMEAKISQLKLILIGHTIQFDNQVLYFQSKSILDVFWVMITHGQVQMKLVGVLLLTFSVFFPLLKLSSTIAYFYNICGAQKNSIIDFFVFKSGKWSMTDVMVVAIFMAYIGFNGIIDSQLSNLSSMEGGATILTTNGTSLQPGYYIFLSYSILAIILSNYLPKTREH